MDALLCGFKSKCNRLNNIKGRKKKKKKKKDISSCCCSALSTQSTSWTPHCWSNSSCRIKSLPQLHISGRLSRALLVMCVSMIDNLVLSNPIKLSSMNKSDTYTDDTMYNHECGDWALREHYKWLGCKWSCWSFICPLSKRLGSMSPLKKIMRWRGSATSCCMQWQHGTELDSHRAS